MPLHYIIFKDHLEPQFQLVIMMLIYVSYLRIFLFTVVLKFHKYMFQNIFWLINEITSFSVYNCFLHALSLSLVQHSMDFNEYFSRKSATDRLFLKYWHVTSCISLVMYKPWFVSMQYSRPAVLANLLLSSGSTANRQHCWSLPF